MAARCFSSVMVDAPRACPGAEEELAACAAGFVFPDIASGGVGRIRLDLEALLAEEKGI